jgi:outer membrane protein OmpA-like peptidoglycan-associated protein
LAVDSDSSIDGGSIGGEAKVPTPVAVEPPTSAVEPPTSVAEAQRQYESDRQVLDKPVAAYAINSASPSPSTKLELDEAAEILQRYPDLRVQIVGHACDIGSDAANVEIGQRRADAAKAYLVEKGIAADRITTVSKGKTQPVAPNTTEENRRKNRRVEIRVVSD